MQQLHRSLALLSVLAAFAPLPAQATPRSITCDAVTTVGNGASLIYKISGSLEFDAAGRPLPPTQDLSSLVMTVQRRDRNGKLQTLLNRTSLANFERIAPDADYSQLPFSGNFRGKPNDGRGLYSARASVSGLFASLRPVDGNPTQVQVVHYLSPAQFVRSAPGSCRVGS